jgi:hypothetical protein
MFEINDPDSGRVTPWSGLERVGKVERGMVGDEAL